MSNPTNQPSPLHTTNPELARAIAEAQLLLAFASRNGKVVDENTIKIVVKAGANAEVSAEDEAVFWKQFGQLAAIAAPTTAQSLQTLTAPDGKKSAAQRVVRYYTCAAIITLLVLILVQAYWAIGTFVVSDINSKMEQIKNLELRILADKELTLQTTADSSNSADKQSYSKGRSSERNQGSLEGTFLKAEMENLEIYLEVNYRWLKRWCYIPNLILQTDTMNDEDSDAVYDEEAGPEEYIEDNISYLQCTIFTLDILNRYLLPLIYGLLGACVYILRDLSSKIKAYAFVDASAINFHIRLCLGTLAGFAVVWCVTPEKTLDPLISISPLALAFLAGYSVELIFALMDKVINAFVNGTQGAPSK